MSGAKLAATAVAFLVLVAVGGAYRDPNTRDLPRIDRVEPAVMRPGDVASASGQYLDRSKVADLLLTNGDLSALTHILEQHATLIRFRLPSTLEAGRYSILLVTREQQPRFIQQDVEIIVR